MRRLRHAAAACRPLHCARVISTLHCFVLPLKRSLWLRRGALRSWAARNVCCLVPILRSLCSCNRLTCAWALLWLLWRLGHSAGAAADDCVDERADIVIRVGIGEAAGRRLGLGAGAQVLRTCTQRNS